MLPSDLIKTLTIKKTMAAGRNGDRSVSRRGLKAVPPEGQTGKNLSPQDGIIVSGNRKGVLWSLNREW